ncbi:MAG: alpha-ketoacid dehydrogenase subunit beta [Dehalococcoidia bacterium]
MTVATRTVSMREAINEALRQEMERDSRVVLLGEDIAGGATTHLGDDSAWGGPLGVTKGLSKHFGRGRVLDTPISESAFVGTAVGAAATGLRPVAELMFVDFVGVCLDQVMNQAAKLRYMFGGKARVPLVIRTMIGGGLRAAGQHSGCHYSIFTHIPGLKTVAPSTPYDAKGLLISAIGDDDPIIFFEHKFMYDLRGPVPEEPYTIPLGQAEVKRQGRDVTIVAISRMVHLALAAAERLVQDGIEAEVVDPRTLSPLDGDAIIASVQRTHRLVVVDEDNPRCSMATDIAALVAERAFDYLDAPIRMVTSPHSPSPFSPVLEDYYLPSSDRIAETVRGLL